jgi:hypothetical protein
MCHLAFTMSTSQSFSEAQARLPDAGEWRRMTREIVSLRQVNAQLADKVVTLEMQLDSIMKEGIAMHVSVSG